MDTRFGEMVSNIVRELLKKLIDTGKPKWLLILLLVFIFGLIYLLWHNYGGNKILKQTIHQQEQMLKQKDEQIQSLQNQLQTLKKEQMELERKIRILKEKQKQIPKPQTAEEIIKAFKELGYEAVVK